MAAAICGCGAGDEPELLRAAAPAPRAPEFVGGEVCASCHRAEAERWRGSHHDLAMQLATEDAVLGDFGDAHLTHFGVTSTFSRRDGRFIVRTDGPDGTLRDYEVAYTFGVDPLQQYLVRFSDGRVQALALAWDTRPEGQGGQRWFHLYPEEPIPHEDLLHWTALQQNWNHMCASCHSTNLRKGYDAGADRFQTTWSEIDVSCEACHGPGSVHAEWGRALQEGTRYDPPPDLGLANPLGNPGAWQFDAGTPIARRSQPLASLEVAQFNQEGQLDNARPALLDQLDRGFHRPAGRQQIVHKQHLRPLLQRILMHLQGVLSVFQRVVRLVRLVGELAFLPDRNDPDPQFAGEGGPHNQPARFNGDDRVRQLALMPDGQRPDRLTEGRPVPQERRDVAEQNPFLGKIRNVTNIAP